MLIQNSYGKSRVRLTKVTRHSDRHELVEIDVAIELEGNFAASYTAGDNRTVIATDSLKNTVYVLARNHPLESIEDFALSLAGHFVERYAQVDEAKVEISAQAWRRIDVNGKPHPHAFVAGGNERRTCTAWKFRDRAEIIHGGIEDLAVLKTTGSAFKDFVSDEFRTLPDADDRIFATTINAEWTFARRPADWNSTFAAARDAILRTFAVHSSLAVQQTLLEIGNAVLKACAEIDTVSLALPNQHRIPFNLTPFQLDNPNIIFVPTSEPFGRITGTIRRDATT
jgi:urate oxidase